MSYFNNDATGGTSFGGFSRENIPQWMADMRNVHENPQQWLPSLFNDETIPKDKLQKVLDELGKGVPVDSALYGGQVEDLTHSPPRMSLDPFRPNPKLPLDEAISSFQFRPGGEVPPVTARTDTGMPAWLTELMNGVEQNVQSSPGRPIVDGFTNSGDIDSPITRFARMLMQRPGSEPLSQMEQMGSTVLRDNPVLSKMGALARGGNASIISKNNPELMARVMKILTKLPSSILTPLLTALGPAMFLNDMGQPADAASMDDWRASAMPKGQNPMSDTEYELRGKAGFWQ
jgi:hypothetical protein